MMTEAVVILEVVEGMVFMVPECDDDSRINLAIQVLEAIKPRSNLMGNDPLEMMCGINSWWFRQMEMGMVDQASLRILCSLMKPDQFAPFLWRRKILQGGGV
jgi:hypothetical protein